MVRAILYDIFCCLRNGSAESFRWRELNEK
jgi:hypothetical protein